MRGSHVAFINPLARIPSSNKKRCTNDGRNVEEEKTVPVNFRQIYGLDKKFSEYLLDIPVSFPPLWMMIIIIIASVTTFLRSMYRFR